VNRQGDEVTSAGGAIQTRASATEKAGRRTVGSLTAGTHRSVFIQFFLVGSRLRKTISFLQECVSAVQGHPRSLILVSIESAYATSY